jgi:hypothetical protein
MVQELQELWEIGSQWIEQHSILLTLLLTLLLLPVGGWMIKAGDNQTWKRDFGVSLLTGGLFLTASLFVQLNLEDSNFRMTISVSDDLTGFDPNGRSLEKMTFSGKNLYRAKLTGSRLTKADLSTAYLGEAKLQRANLREADLAYAILFRSNIANSIFEDANLRGAEISTDFSEAELTGAKVHGETCWKMRLDESYPRIIGEDAVVLTEDEPVVKKLITGGLEPSDGKTLGHVCDMHEMKRPLGKQSGGPDIKEDPRVYICRAGTLKVRSPKDQDPCRQ